MKINWSKINKFIYKYRWYISVVLIVFFSLCWVSGAASSIMPSAESIANAIISGFGVLLYYILFIPLTWLIAIAMWVLIEVASFQYFINVPAVVDGWILMRDLVNMMFVMYLLYLAFTTILSLAKDFQKTLIKLILAVILVNFSRMIVGMLIDFSQIVMLTFVNGFRNVAGGNLINGLGLKEIVNKAATMTTDSVAIDNFMRISLGIFAAILVFSTLAMMAAFFILRVVKLWILTVMSPLMAMGFLFSGLKEFTGKWKKEFSDCLMGGPFMAFYLWLSLTIIATTGEETALTTPTGSLADSLEGGSASDQKVISSGVFRMAIGAGILYASFQMAKGMAGEAAKVGDAVYGYTKGKAIGGAKAIAKTADAGLGLATSRVFHKDISFGGAKRYVAKTKKKVKAGIAAKKRQWLQKGLKGGQLSALKKGKKKPKFKGLTKESTKLKGQIEEKDTELQGLSEQEKTLGKKEETYENAQNKMSKVKESGQTKLSAAGKLQQAMTTDPGNRLGYNETMSSIDQLVASGGMGQAQAEQLKKKFVKTQGADGLEAQFRGSPDMKDKVSEIGQKAQETLSVADQLEDPNLGEAERKQLLQKHGQDFGLEADEQDVLATGTGSISEQLENIQQRKASIETEKAGLESKKSQIDKEKTKMLMKELLKDRQSLGRMVLRDRSSENRKVQREFYQEKYAGIDNPKEFAAAIERVDNTEELNYLLEQAKDDVSEVLDNLGAERNLDGLKGLYASKIKKPTGASVNKLKNNPKLSINNKADIKKLIDKVKKGNGDMIESNAITEYANDNMTRDDLESMDVIGKQNRSSNLSLSYSVTLEPDGMQKLETTENQMKTIESKYKRGGVGSKALTPALTNKTDSGKVVLTDMGRSFALTHPREISKDNIADEMGKDFLNAIQNDFENLRKLVKEGVKQGTIKGSLSEKDGKPVPANNFNPKEGYKNQASYILHSLDKMNSQVGDSQHDALMKLMKEMRDKQ